MMSSHRGNMLSSLKRLVTLELHQAKVTRAECEAALSRSEHVRDRADVAFTETGARMGIAVAAGQSIDMPGLCWSMDRSAEQLSSLQAAEARVRADAAAVQQAEIAVNAKRRKEDSVSDSLRVEEKRHRQMLGNRLDTEAEELWLMRRV